MTREEIEKAMRETRRRLYAPRDFHRRKRPGNRKIRPARHACKNDLESGLSFVAFRSSSFTVS